MNIKHWTLTIDSKRHFLQNQHTFERNVGSERFSALSGTRSKEMIKYFRLYVAHVRKLNEEIK